MVDILKKIRKSTMMKKDHNTTILIVTENAKISKQGQYIVQCLKVLNMMAKISVFVFLDVFNSSKTKTLSLQTRKFKATVLIY
jgi:hypothetical protein